MKALLWRTTEQSCGRLPGATWRTSTHS